MEGIGWFSFEVIRRLAAAHKEVQFIYAFDRPFEERFITSDNIKPVVLRPPARHPLLFWLFFEWAIPRLVHREKPDVFFSPDGFLSLRAPVPTLLTIHDLAYAHFPRQVGWLAQKYYERYMPLFAQRAERITAVSTYTKNDIVQRLGCAEGKIDVVYNGCNEAYAPLSEDEKTAARLRWSEGEAYFIYVGSIHPRKNVARLLRAFEEFKKTTAGAERVKLLLVGRMAWQTGEVGEALESMQHRKDVILLGYVEMASLPQLVGAALASVYVSLFEGFGVPILEAMRAGVPVILSDTSSMPEVAGGAGILVNPHSIDSIAKGLQQVFSDSDLRQKMQREGIESSQRFGWDLTAQKVWSSLERCLSMGSTTAGEK